MAFKPSDKALNRVWDDPAAQERQEQAEREAPARKRISARVMVALAGYDSGYESAAQAANALWHSFTGRGFDHEREVDANERHIRLGHRFGQIALDVAQEMHGLDTSPALRGVDVAAPGQHEQFVTRAPQLVQDGEGRTTGILTPVVASSDETFERPDQEGLPGVPAAWWVKNTWQAALLSQDPDWWPDGQQMPRMQVAHYHPMRDEVRLRDLPFDGRFARDLGKRARWFAECVADDRLPVPEGRELAPVPLPEAATGERRLSDPDQIQRFQQAALMWQQAHETFTAAAVELQRVERMIANGMDKYGLSLDRGEVLTIGEVERPEGGALAVRVTPAEQGGITIVAEPPAGHPAPVRAQQSEVAPRRRRRADRGEPTVGG